MTTAARPTTASLDETAWLAFATRHHPAMVKVAEAFLGDAAEAERLALGVWRDTSASELLAGSSADAGRTLVAVVIERAWTASGAVLDVATGADTSPFPRERFLSDDHERWPGHWAVPPGAVDPAAWTGAGGRRAAAEAFSGLTTFERVVLTLHDVASWTTQEIGDVLGIDVAAVRALLGSARWAVAAKLDAAIRGG
jgi:hypothetical protein